MAISLKETLLALFWKEGTNRVATVPLWHFNLFYQNGHMKRPNLNLLPEKHKVQTQFHPIWPQSICNRSLSIRNKSPLPIGVKQLRNNWTMPLCRKDKGRGGTGGKKVSSTRSVRVTWSRGGISTVEYLTVSLQSLGKSWSVSSRDTFLGTWGRRKWLGTVSTDLPRTNHVSPIWLLFVINWLDLQMRETSG